RFRAHWLLHKDFVIGIWSPDEAELLGGCGFHLRDGPLEHGNAEMGMWIAAAHAGRGLGTEALREMVAWGFTEWPWVRLSWRCNALNTASARVAEKAGLQLEAKLKSQMITQAGERRDTLCYAILKPTS
ncbi:MAG: GNAT family N-acetyltransferase, partial [Planctomycetota bacterium]